MQSTISDIRQLFKVNTIAGVEADLDTMADGILAIINADTNAIVAPTNFATLPDKFRFVLKNNGKTYISKEDMLKANIMNGQAEAYQTEQVNIWEAVIDHCKCISGFQLNIGIDEDSLLRRDGLTWAHTDFIVDVSPEEILCYCDCTGTYPVYENNLITKVLAEKVNAADSPFYEAEIHLDVSGLTTYADEATRDGAVGSPDQGDIFIVTDTGLTQYDGAAYQTVGTIAGVITDVDTFIETNKTVNTDADATNNGQNLKLVIQGKAQTAGLYKDLEVNYVFPRGVRLNPVLKLNSGDKVISFTETQDLRYELGAGYDLRKEEFDAMSLYTNLNYYPTLQDGVASSDLVFQFQNGENYSCVTFEVATKKSGLQGTFEDNTKRMVITLGTTNGSTYSTLSTIFAS